MELYEVEGMYKGEPISLVHVDSWYDVENENKGVEVQLWKQNPDWREELRLKPGMYAYIVIETLHYVNEQDYESLLFDKRSKTTAKKYIKKLGLKTKKSVF